MLGGIPLSQGKRPAPVSHRTEGGTTTPRRCGEGGGLGQQVGIRSWVGWDAELAPKGASSPRSSVTWLAAGGCDLNIVSDPPNEVWRKLCLPQCGWRRVAPTFQGKAAASPSIQCCTGTGIYLGEETTSPSDSSG